MGEVFEKLPKELQRSIFLYLSTPTADIIREAEKYIYKGGDACDWLHFPKRYVDDDPSSPTTISIISMAYNLQQQIYLHRIYQFI
jgi:hypothetical protein